MAVEFWNLQNGASSIALVDERGSCTYAELSSLAHSLQPPTSADRKRLGFLVCQNTRECLATYLGALTTRSAVALLGTNLSRAALANLVSVYSPDWIAGKVVPCFDGYIRRSEAEHINFQFATIPSQRVIHSDLAVLLSTSGSTGSPKLVRLSYNNIQSNAEQITDYLRINAQERAITSLPMQYSYGLSVINSHLLAGASLVLTDETIAQRKFWDCFQLNEATSLSGVPYMYQMLLRLGFLKWRLPSLKTLTQAGGALAPHFAKQVHDLCEAQGRLFYVMYGQTEATARIAYVPPSALKGKYGSIGVAVPRGSLSLDPATDEIIYRGPNVMLGYAQDITDLAKGDDLQGELRTGDLGRRDNEGYFYVTGRSKRMVKIFGQRFSLDELEFALQKQFNVPVACYGSDDRLRIAVEDERLTATLGKFIADEYRLHGSAFSVVVCPQLPHNVNGKIDYLSLESSSI